MKVLEEEILPIYTKLMHKKIDDLLEAVDLTFLGLFDILIYQTAMLFRLDQDIRILRFASDQIRLNHLSLQENIYVL